VSENLTLPLKPHVVDETAIERAQVPQHHLPPLLVHLERCVLARHTPRFEDKLAIQLPADAI